MILKIMISRFFDQFQKLLLGDFTIHSEETLQRFMIHNQVSYVNEGALHSHFDFLQTNIFYSNDHEELIFSPFRSTMLQNAVRA